MEEGAPWPAREAEEEAPFWPPPPSPLDDGAEEFALGAPVVGPAPVWTPVWPPRGSNPTALAPTLLDVANANLDCISEDGAPLGDADELAD